MTSSIHQRFLGGELEMIFNGKNENNCRLPNLERSNPKPFAREFLVLALWNSWNPRTSPPITFLTPDVFPRLPKSSCFGCAFPQQHRVLKSFMFGSTVSPKMVSFEGLVFHDFFVFVAWWTHVRVSTFLPKNGTTCYPSIKSIAQQPLIFAHREVFSPALWTQLCTNVCLQKMGTT